MIKREVDGCIMVKNKKMTLISISISALYFTLQTTIPLK